MAKKEELGGKTFDRLTVLEYAYRSKWGAAVWRCQCSCGNERLIPAARLKNGGSRSCGCLQTELNKKRVGPLHPCWKGGKFVRNGYVRLEGVAHTGHPRKTILEHRAVMAKALGRPLTKQEEVHHKYGNRTDNRIESLELWSTSHPAGQRVEDLVKWAKELLQKYEPSALVEQHNLVEVNFL